MKKNKLHKRSKTNRRVSAYSHENYVKIVHSGSEYFDILKQLIKQANVFIHIQVYIFGDDETGHAIADTLIAAAKRGVAVYLLVDGYESRGLPLHFIKQMTNANIHFERFEPLFRSKNFYVGRRLHHKVVVIDGVMGLVGGINIADRYNDVDGIPAWLDMALLVHGESAAQLNDICCRMWQETTGKKISTKPADIHNAMMPEGMKDQCSIRIRRNDWVKAQNQIWKSYFEMFNQASESIVIMCSYFLPGWTFMKRMKKAMARGVKIKVILAGISDVMLAKHAERYLYRWMFKYGIEIYEYKEAILHAKVAVRDCKWMTIGSYNVNNISAYASVELNIDIRNRPFVSQVQDELLKIATEKSIKITEDNFYVTQNALKRFWQWGCYQTIKIILYLATFYFKQDRGIDYQ